MAQKCKKLKKNAKWPFLEKGEILQSLRTLCELNFQATKMFQYFSEIPGIVE